jgi:hypothetical protein
MKNIPTRIVTFFLAFLILFSSNGFGLVEHSCSLRGKKSYSFETKEVCKFCGSHKSSIPGQATFLKSKCCEVKQIEPKQNIANTVVEWSGKVLKDVAHYIAKSIAFILSSLAVALLEFFSKPDTDNSSLFGRSLLQFISLFRL